MSSTDNNIRIETHTITTRDDISLTATLYRPKHHNEHTVLISGAMGMPQRFYRHYAQYLAENGCVVLTFDFRGIAQSRTRDNLWGYNADLTDWATQDLRAVLRWLRRHYPDSQLNVVAHSLGGHLLGASSEITNVKTILGISAQNTYWRNWSLMQQVPATLFWFVILPILSYAMGYFPSRWFGMGEPLPKRVALDWSRGASHPQGNKSLFTGTSHDHYGEFTGTTCFYSFSDDALMAPRKSVDEILAYYPNALHQERRHITPQQIGVDSIGHSHFFRPKMRETLWQESLDFILHPSFEQVSPPITTIVGDPIANAS